MGINKKDYQEAQEIKSEDDFKFQTNQRIQNFQFEIDRIKKSLNESIAKQGSLEVEFETELKEVISSTMLSLKEFRQTLGDFETEFANRERWFKQMKEIIDEKTDVSNFNKKISDLNMCITILHKEKESLRNEFNSLIDRLKLDFENRLKAQKEEILSIPSEIPNLKKVLDQKLELVELNGQNSVLRSSNNEKQILLLERKIENIYQLIKKLEIAYEGSK